MNGVGISSPKNRKKKEEEDDKTPRLRENKERKK